VKEKTSTQRKRPFSSDGRVLVLQPDKQLASAVLSALLQAAPDARVEMAHDLEEAQRLVLGVKPELFVLDVDAIQDPGRSHVGIWRGAAIRSGGKPERDWVLE